MGTPPAQRVLWHVRLKTDKPFKTAKESTSAGENMAKYKYRLMNGTEHRDRNPKSSLHGKPLLIETDQEKHQEFAQVTANKQLFSLPGYKTLYIHAKTGPGEHPFGVVSLRVFFKDGMMRVMT